MKDPIRVLILDDNQNDADLLVDEIKRAGFVVEWVRVATNEELIREVDESPDIILAEYSMPQLTAFQAIKILKEAGLSIPLIVVSREITEESVVHCIKEGVIDCLHKDRLDRLGTAVKQSLADARNQGERQFSEGALAEREANFSQREMEVVISVNAALRRAQNCEMMLPLIADIILDIAPAIGVMISLVDPLSGQLQPASVSGEWQKIPGLKLQLDQFEVDDMFEHNQSLHWDDPARAAELSIEPHEIGQNPLICIPLTSSNENIGVVWVGCDPEYIHNSLHLMEVVANIAATAIHRTTLNEDNLRALQESDAIANISRTLNQSLDLDTIFGQIVQEATRIIGEAFRAVIHLFDEQNRRLYAVALAEMKEGLIETRSLIKIRVSPDNEFDFGVLDEKDIRSSSMYAGQGVAGKVIESGQPMIVADTQLDERYLQVEPETEARSLVVTPILGGERRLGTLSVLGGSPNLFNSADQNLLERLCLQVAIAIENARLLEAERQQRELAMAQAEISALLNKTLSLDDVLAGIIDHTLRFFNAQAANIMLVKGDRLQVVRQNGYDPEVSSPTFSTVKIGDLPVDSILRRVYETGEKIAVLDSKNGEESEAKTIVGRLRSFVCIPLKVGSQVIGLLNVDSEKPFAFGELELQQLGIFANSASIAVNNAQLYQVLEQSLQTEKSTRLQLIRADKLAGMGRMVASVAHELNNPLQTIKNCLFLIEQSIKQEDVELLDLALSEVERLSSIVNRLRDVYRPVAYEEIQQASLLPMLVDLEKLLETHLRRHAVELEIQTNEIEDVLVQAFPDQLKQVFLNLSLNGIEAMQPGGGKLKISVKRDRGKRRVGIMFSDTGPGIPEQELELIFDPFYTTKSAGMGLGLSICYDIVENHSGMIEVKNNEDGGVTFAVWLPMQEGER